MKVCFGDCRLLIQAKNSPLSQNIKKGLDNVVANIRIYFIISYCSRQIFDDYNYVDYIWYVLYSCLRERSCLYR